MALNAKVFFKFTSKAKYICKHFFFENITVSVTFFHQCSHNNALIINQNAIIPSKLLYILLYIVFLFFIKRPIEYFMRKWNVDKKTSIVLYLNLVTHSPQKASITAKIFARNSHTRIYMFPYLFQINKRTSFPNYLHSICFMLLL